MAALNRTEIYSTALCDADLLLAQWAAWASNDLRRLDYSASRWQHEYRASFDPEIIPDGKEIEPGDDATMQRVDFALAQLGHTDAHSAHVLRARYRLGYQFVHRALDAALRQFISIYDGLTC